MIAAVLFASALAAQGPQPSPEPRADVVKLFEDAAAALSSENPKDFLDYFDDQMTGYSTLSEEVLALVSWAQVTSSIKFMSDAGDDSKREVELDWQLGVEGKRANRGQQDGQRAQGEERRAAVKCRIEKRGKKWKITAFEPIDFFKFPE